MSVEITSMGRSPFADFTARLEEGEILFRTGDPGMTLFVIQAGRMEILRPSGPGVAPVTIMEKGDFFGEMSLLEGTPRTFTARALCASTVIEIGAALFDRMIRTNVELGVRMLRKLSQRLSAAEALAQQGGIAAVPASVTPPRPAAGRPVSPDNGSRPVNSGRTAPAAAAGKTPSEVFLVNTEGGEIFRLKITDQPLHVGRFDPVTSVRPEVDLTLLDLKRSVSRRHATLTRGGGGFHLTEEVGALNGTRINGTPLTPGQPASLQDGDQISFGSVVLSFKTSPPEAAPSAN